MKIALALQATYKSGGAVTYAEHLARSLRLSGLEVSIVEVKESVDRFADKYGRRLPNGDFCHKISLEKAKGIAKEGKLIIASSYVPDTGSLIIKELLKAGAYIVMHSPVDIDPVLSIMEEIGYDRQPVAVRKRISDMYQDRVVSRYIPHPFVPKGSAPTKKKFAVSISRVDRTKNTDIIVKANMKLPEEKQIEIFGPLNRDYAKELDAIDENWGSNFCGEYSPCIYHPVYSASLSVDMSAFEGEGDGTQYSFLESWDAEAVLIVNSKWILKGDQEVRDNETAIAVTDETDLAEMVSSFSENRDMIAAGKRELEKHKPEVVAPMYREWLEV